MDNETFVGYLMNEQEQYTEGKHLKGFTEVCEFFVKNIETTYEIRITDKDDCIVMKIVNKKLLFPLFGGMHANNIWNSNLKKFVNC